MQVGAGQVGAGQVGRRQGTVRGRTATELNALCPLATAANTAERSARAVRQNAQPTGASNKGAKTSRRVVLRRDALYCVVTRCSGDVQIERPYDTFSTLQPLTTVPSAQRTKAHR